MGRGVELVKRLLIVEVEVSLLIPKGGRPRVPRILDCSLRYLLTFVSCLFYGPTRTRSNREGATVLIIYS